MCIRDRSIYFHRSDNFINFNGYLPSIVYNKILRDNAIKIYIKILFIFLTIFTNSGCSEYSFNELNPFNLFCSGSFDPETNSCTIKTDFPNPTKE